MPELPDIVVYLGALRRFIGGQRIESVDLRSPFVVRSCDPDLSVIEGLRVEALRRLGKRIVWELESELFLVFHLMIAGRFHWRKPEVKPRGKHDLAAFHFENGTMMLTEASGKKRASLHVVAGAEGLVEHARGGIEVLDCDLSEFRETLLRENRTLKRALTAPHLFSGIGNAYSDEILHAAKLSPVKLTQRLSSDEVTRLFSSTRHVLEQWIARLAERVGESFPEKVTAFRDEMSVHGKFGLPCPICGTPIQRIVRKEHETNYCPRCQTEGKVLKDRSLSRLLRDDWPESVEAWEV